MSNGQSGFNAEQTLSACLESLKAQTYECLEILVVDDGSFDNTQAIAEEFSRADERIRCLRVPNGGVSAARNVGLTNARGKFIFFVDADDELFPEGINLLVKGFQKSGCPLIIGGFDRYNPAPMNSADSLVFPEDRLLDAQDIEDYVFRYLGAPNKNPLFATTWGRLVLAEVIRDNNLMFDENMRTMEDVDFNFRLLRHVGATYYVSSRIYKYRVYSSSASQSTKALTHSGGVLGFVKALDSADKYLVSRGCERAKVDLWIGHAYIVYTIISLIRICLQWSWGNTGSVYRFCEALVFSEYIDKYRLQYRPGPGDSKVIPFLLELRSVWGVMCFCKAKAWIRYGFSG